MAALALRFFFIFESNSDAAAKCIEEELERLRLVVGKEVVLRAFNLRQQTMDDIFARAGEVHRVVLLGTIPRGDAPLHLGGAIRRMAELPLEHRKTCFIADMPNSELEHFRAFAQMHVIYRVAPLCVTAEMNLFREGAPSLFEAALSEEAAAAAKEAEKQRKARERQRVSAATRIAKKETSEGKQSKNTKIGQFFSS